MDREVEERFDRIEENLAETTKNLAEASKIGKETNAISKETWLLVRENQKQIQAMLSLLPNGKNAIEDSPRSVYEDRGITTV